jgi:tetratricopeptide (TPR) repeat protein
MSGLVSPEFIEMFNKAAGLAREGKFEESLAAWNELLDPEKERDKDLPTLSMTGEFLGVAMMRKAWVLMDLERYEDALEVFEDDLMQACLGQFDLETLFEYYFSYGNTLGNLRNIDAMDDAFSRALGIAAEELGDMTRCLNTWMNLMEYALQSEAWKYLERESRNAQAFSENTDNDLLRTKAGWYHVQALKELGRTKEAREEAEALHAFLVDKGADEAAAAVKEFIDGL